MFALIRLEPFCTRTVALLPILGVNTNCVHGVVVVDELVESVPGTLCGSSELVFRFLLRELSLNARRSTVDDARFLFDADDLLVIRIVRVGVGPIFGRQRWFDMKILDVYCQVFVSLD